MSSASERLLCETLVSTISSSLQQFSVGWWHIWPPGILFHLKTSELHKDLTPARPRLKSDSTLKIKTCSWIKTTRRVFYMLLYCVPLSSHQINPHLSSRWQSFRESENKAKHGVKKTLKHHLVWEQVCLKTPMIPCCLCLQYWFDWLTDCVFYTIIE